MIRPYRGVESGLRATPMGRAKKKKKCITLPTVGRE